MKKFVAKCIASDVYHCSIKDLSKANEWLEIIGNDVRKLKVDLWDSSKDPDLSSMAEMWSLIRKTCANNLLQKQIDVCDVSSLQMCMSLPSLQGLVLGFYAKCFGVPPEMLKLINCPKLKHFETLGSCEYPTLPLEGTHKFFGISFETYE